MTRSCKLDPASADRPYDGTDLVGWQRQADGRLGPGAARGRARARSRAAPVTVHGAGRTDAGVHALAQVASVDARPRRTRPSAIQRGLNAVLPPAVRVIAVEDAPPGFHARFDAAGKVYEYRIVNAPFVSPFLRALRLARAAAARRRGDARGRRRAGRASRLRRVSGHRQRRQATPCARVESIEWRGGRPATDAAPLVIDAHGRRLPPPHGPQHRRHAGRRRAAAAGRPAAVAAILASPRPGAGRPDGAAAGAVPGRACATDAGCFIMQSMMPVRLAGGS